MEAAYYGDQPDPGDGREAMWEHLLGVDGGVTYVVEDRGAIVAFMSARHLDDPEPILEMSGLYVLPGRFGRGTGKRLHEVFESERRLDEAGLLEVWEGNHRAIDVYRRHGWVATSTSRPGPRDTPFITYRLATGYPADRTDALTCRCPCTDLPMSGNSRAYARGHAGRGIR